MGRQLPEARFARAYREAFFDISARRAWGPNGPDASVEPDDRGVRGDSDSGVPLDKNDRQTSGEPGHYGKRATDWRNRNVAGGCEKREVRGRGRRRLGLFDPYVAHGGDESGTSDLDWSLPDSFGCLPRNVAIDVHHCGRAVGGDVASIGA